MQRVLILGDSLSYPRPRHGQRFDEVWPVRLKSRFPAIDIWQRARPGSTVLDTLREFLYFSDSLAAFSSIVVQVGVTDSCPRPYPFWVHQLLQIFLSQSTQRWINHNYHSLLKLRAKPWVSTNEFAISLRQIMEISKKANPQLRLAFLTIAPAKHSYLKKVPLVAEHIQLYNRVMAEVVASQGDGGRVVLIDPYTQADTDQLLVEDGHHLTQLGHQRVAEAVAPLLETICQ